MRVEQLPSEGGVSRAQRQAVAVQVVEIGLHVARVENGIAAIAPPHVAGVVDHEHPLVGRWRCHAQLVQPDGDTEPDAPLGQEAAHLFQEIEVGLLRCRRPVAVDLHLPHAGHIARFTHLQHAVHQQGCHAVDAVAQTILHHKDGGNHLNAGRDGVVEAQGGVGHGAAVAQHHIEEPDVHLPYVVPSQNLPLGAVEFQHGAPVINGRRGVLHRLGRVAASAPGDA